MSMTKVGPKHQVTIPKPVFEQLNLAVGDYLHIRARGWVITMVPAKLVPKDQAWFYTPEWQKKEAQADADIAKGRLSGPFISAEALLKHLGRQKRRKRR